MLVICRRGAGDRPAPQDVVDPLCCTPVVAVARGTAYLDGQEAAGDVRIVVAGDAGPPDVGGMVDVVTAEQTTEAMRVAGWELTVEHGDALMTLDLQRRRT